MQEQSCPGRDGGSNTAAEVADEEAAGTIQPLISSSRCSQNPPKSCSGSPPSAESVLNLYSNAAAEGATHNSDRHQLHCTTEDLSTLSEREGVGGTSSGETVCVSAELVAAVASPRSHEPSDSPLPEDADRLHASAPLGSISSSVFGSVEPLGLTAIVSAVGSWVSAAFDKHQEENATIEGVSTGASELSESTEASPESRARPVVGEDVATAKNTATQVSVLSLSPKPSVDEPIECLSTSQTSLEESPLPEDEGLHREPTVLLHLCGQTEPIRWSPNDCCPSQGDESECLYHNGDFNSHQIDPHLLRVPDPDELVEDPLELPVRQMSFHEIADNIEMWLLSSGQRILNAREDDSVSSSDSIEETPGAPLLDVMETSSINTDKAHVNDPASYDEFVGVHGDVCMPESQPHASGGADISEDTVNFSRLAGGDELETVTPFRRTLYTALRLPGAENNVAAGKRSSGLVQQTGDTAAPGGLTEATDADLKMGSTQGRCARHCQPFADRGTQYLARAEKSAVVGAGCTSPQETPTSAARVNVPEDTTGMPSEGHTKREELQTFGESANRDLGTAMPFPNCEVLPSVVAMP